MATATTKSPRQLLQDMWDLLAQEADSLKSRRTSDLAGDELEDSSKQLNRLITSLRGAIKDATEFEAKQRGEVGDMSEADIVPALLDDPQYRKMFAAGLRNMGWTVKEPEAAEAFGAKPEKSPKQKRHMMKAPPKKKVKSILDSFEVPDE